MALEEVGVLFLVFGGDGPSREIQCNCMQEAEVYSKLTIFAATWRKSDGIRRSWGPIDYGTASVVGTKIHCTGKNQWCSGASSGRPSRCLAPAQRRSGSDKRKHMFFLFLFLLSAVVVCVCVCVCLSHPSPLMLVWCVKI